MICPFETKLELIQLSIFWSWRSNVELTVSFRNTHGHLVDDLVSDHLIYECVSLLQQTSLQHVASAFVPQFFIDDDKKH